MLFFKSGAKIAIFCALIMFFMPFVMVSCSEANEKETYSGVDLIVCSTEGDSFIASSRIDKDKLLPNIWLIGACALGIVALVASFVKRKSFFPCVLAAVSAVLLIIFRASFVSYYNLKDVAKYLEIKVQWGYILCLIFMIIGAVLNYVQYRHKPQIGE